MIIRTRRIAFEHTEALSSIHRTVDRGVWHVDNVRIFRIHGDLVEVPAAAPNSMVLGNLLPVLSAIIRAVQPALLGIHDEINPFRITRRKRNPHSSQAFRRQSLSFYLLPMVSAVVRAIKPAARPVRRRVNAPRGPSRLPQRGIYCFRIPRLERQVNRTRVFIMEQHSLPVGTAIV